MSITDSMQKKYATSDRQNTSRREGVYVFIISIWLLANQYLNSTPRETCNAVKIIFWNRQSLVASPDMGPCTMYGSSVLYFLKKGCDPIFVLWLQDSNMGSCAVCGSHILYFLETENRRKSSPFV